MNDLDLVEFYVSAGLIQDKIKTVYCHVASTWNLDVVAYIIHTYIYINTHTYIHTI